MLEAWQVCLCCVLCGACCDAVCVCVWRADVTVNDSDADGRARLLARLSGSLGAGQRVAGSGESWRVVQAWIVAVCGPSVLSGVDVVMWLGTTLNAWGTMCTALPALVDTVDAGNLTVRFTSDEIFQYSGFTAVLEGSLCPGGTYSATGRPVNGSCPGVCLAGHACPAGSTNGTAVACAGATFGASGLDRCPVVYMEDRCEGTILSLLCGPQCGV
jgi:hypothetical protein